MEKINNLLDFCASMTMDNNNVKKITYLRKRLQRYNSRCKLKNVLYVDENTQRELNLENDIITDKIIELYRDIVMLIP